MADSKTYPLPDAAVVADRLQAAGASQGPALNLAADSGQATAHGVKLQWSVDREAKTVTVTIVSHPFFVPESVIWSDIDKLLA